MSETPEGAVKKKVKTLLAALKIMPASKAGAVPEGATGWYFMPVQGGRGVNGIPDFLGHYRGRFFALETKAPGKKPSGFQQLQIDAIFSTGAAVFVIDGDLSGFVTWAEQVETDWRRLVGKK